MGVAMIHPDIPIAGHYRARMVKGGPFVGIEIRDVSDRDPETGELMEDQRWEAVRDGEPVPVDRVWPHCALHPITRAEYEFMTADADHARRWRDNDPKAMPLAPIDPLTAPIPF